MKSRIQTIQEKILSAAKFSGRDPSDIRLVAVSKTKPSTEIRKAYDLGLRDFGENYMQESVVKIAELRDSCPDALWHFIGPLQSNKAKDLVENFNYFHALDRLSLAKKIHTHLEKLNRSIRALVQVNVDYEESKSGVSPKDVEALIIDLIAFPRIRVVGLMCIPSPNQTNPAHPFRKLANLQREINAKRIYPHSLEELSMGMTQDFEVAIHEGASMIRLGTAIFGARG